MLTILTGAPGSGKTLYAIAKLLYPLMGTHVDGVDDEGRKVRHERTLFSNINGLTLPHEKIDADWLADWHNRVPPGAVICYDEVQKPWPKRVTGSKVHQAVQELETHRHKGVDFVLMTQKPELVDQNVCSLAGRHLHIRRVGNTHNAIVYEWDAVSRSLLYRNAFKKSTWRYPRWVFDWYKSAEVHTKMPRSLPTALFIALFAVAGTAVAWPMLMDRITEGLNPTAKAHQAAPQASKPLAPSLILPDAPEVPSATSLAASAVLPAAPVLMGCAAAANACRCYDQAGLPVELEIEACQAKLASPVPAKTAQDLQRVGSPAQEATDAMEVHQDAAVIGAMRSGAPR